jgi:hypothetical protein
MATVMKNLIIILLLFFTMNLSAQYDHRFTKKSTTSLAMDLSSIVLDAMGDAYMDMGRKDLGHALNAASIGMLAVEPFVIDFKKEDWKWKLPAYILLRFAVFDATYNLTRDLPISNFGTTSNYDRFMNQTCPGNTSLMPKGLSFVVGVSIILRYGQ